MDKHVEQLLRVQQQVVKQTSEVAAKVARSSRHAHAAKSSVVGVAWMRSKVQKRESVETRQAIAFVTQTLRLTPKTK